MNTRSFIAFVSVALIALCRLVSAASDPILIFSDNFNNGASSQWGNEVGSWFASGGVYDSQFPSNSPPTYSSLPFDLVDFTIDVDINKVQDGGIWLRSQDNANGVLLVTGGHNQTGTGLYWHEIVNGNVSAPMNEVTGLFTSGVSDAHIKVRVRGSTYEAFVNNAATPATSFTSSTFSHGKVALYDFSNQTFDNVAVNILPDSLLNISTRMRVLTGDNALIGGLILTGSDPKKVIIRGIGPSLTSQGVPDALADPVLELHDHTGALVASNDNWKDTQQTEIEATGIPPTNDLESAIVATLPANSSGTAVLRGKNNTTGVGLVEVYDLDQAANSKLANISTRGFIDTGDNVMIGGFIVGGGSSAETAKVIVRAIGPSLTNSGVPGALQDPTLELHDGSGALIASNDNWKDTQQTEIEASTIPPTDDRESAIVQTLAAGPYTAIVRGKNNTTGVGLVEVYNIPESCVAPPANLVSWWPGDGTAKDIQDGNDGTLQGGATFGPGEVGRAFSFNGNNQYVLINDSSNLRQQQLTVDAWVNAHSVGDINDTLGAVIFNKDRGNVSGAPVSYALFGPGNTGRFTAAIDFTDSTNAVVTSNDSFSFNQWYHVAMTWDGSTLQLFVNGTLEGSTTVGAKTIIYSSDPAAIGRHSHVDRSFDGLIDEVELFNRALSASEVLAIYDAGGFGKCKP